MFLVCYNLLNSQNMIGCKDTSNVVKKAAEVAQKKEQ